MIKVLKPSSLDKKYSLSRKYTVTPISIDFKQKLVNKPWGNEYLMFANSDTEVWNLFIRHQRSTSMHCHPNKRTALIVIGGRATFSSLNESWELLPLDTIIIDAGVFHSTQSISNEGLQLLELETPPMKHDLLRLEDKYGRAEKGYEGIEKMIFDTERPRFSEAKKGVIENVCNHEMCIKEIKNQDDLKNENNTTTTLVAILGGVVKTRAGELIYGPSNVITVEELKDTDCTFDNVSALFINPKK